MKPRDVHPDLWRYEDRRGKALMWFYRLAPKRVSWAVFRWRVNRTPGPRWPR